VPKARRNRSYRPCRPARICTDIWATTPTSRNSTNCSARNTAEPPARPARTHTRRAETMSQQPAASTFKPKKSVALSGVVAGNTALCTVGRTGNDLHYRGYDILDLARASEFEEIAYLLVH